MGKKKNKDFIEFDIDIDEPIYTTGVIQKLLDIPIWVIKQLDREGIVSPMRKVKGTARLYSKRELKQLAHCWEYMDKKGVKVKGLKVILEMEKGSSE
jgi:DNA-binding transcriptional MerR regulator